MIIGIGCDIIEINRVEKAVKSESFKQRVFTEAEIAYCESRGKQQFASFAARFAAKEAVLKAFGTGLRGGAFIIFADFIGGSNLSLLSHRRGKAQGAKCISSSSTICNWSIRHQQCNVYQNVCHDLYVKRLVCMCIAHGSKKSG